MTCQFCNSQESIEGNGTFNCGSYRSEHCGFRSSECQLGEKILKLTKERDELKAINHSANLDWADDDTKLREMCQKVGIPQSLIDGDTHYVPHIVGLGELLVQKIEGLSLRVGQLEAAGDVLWSHIACGCGVDGPCKSCSKAIQGWEELKP